MRNEIVIKRARDETIQAATNAHIWLQSAASPLQQKLHRMLRAAAYDVVDVCTKDKLLPFPATLHLHFHNEKRRVLLLYDNLLSGRHQARAPV